MPTEILTLTPVACVLLAVGVVLYFLRFLASARRVVSAFPVGRLSTGSRPTG